MASERRGQPSGRSGGQRRSSTAPAPRPRADQVRVRMYGQGLGDCFLLAFPRSGAAAAGAGRPVYVLIDCGVVAGTPGGPERMRAVVDDIRATTWDDRLGKGHLDLLIITHEHWDHLSGFVQARETWSQIQVDALWMAWTERPDRDEPGGLPAALRTIRDRQRRMLAEVADRALQFGLEDHHERVVGLMSFLADAAAGQPFGAAASVGAAFAAAQALVPAERHVFCEPGEVRPVPGTDAVAYVLGPPRSDARLRQIAPSRQSPETYAEAAPAAPAGGADPAFSLRQVAEGRSPLNAFAMPLVGPSLPAAGRQPASGEDGGATADMDEEQDLHDRSFPFDPSLRIALPEAEAAVQEARALPPAGAAGPDRPPVHPALAAYFQEVNRWRRIDFDWLGAAEAFALQADTLTNNTSLVLAFELPAAAPGSERKVLLFVGDAQVGNWLSWEEIPAWQPRDGAQPAQARPDIGDLLRRTVFYKVGHHGSHNATLKAKGVERMRADGGLTAFVPVSPRVARDLKDWCLMPLDALLDALAQRTGGRVVLPNGNVWPPVAADQLAEARARVSLTVSTALLPAMVRERDGAEIEGAVPLWVELAIDS